MPQLDPHFFATQIFWLVVCFVALYVILSAVAIPRVGGVIEERQRRIDDNLERAGALKAEAEAAMAAYEKAMTEARTGAREILRQAGDAIAKQAEERQKVLGDKLAAQIKAGEERIGETKRQALAEVQAIAADLARSAALKLADITVDEARASAAVKAASQASGAH